MSDLKDKIIINIHKGMNSNMLSNDDMVQIIEVCGSYLNIKTIPDYATQNNLSYNGAKNHRNVRKIFNVRFVIEND
jgi:hypothetical protein